MFKPQASLASCMRFHHHFTPQVLGLEHNSGLNLENCRLLVVLDTELGTFSPTSSRSFIHSLIHPFAQAFKYVFPKGQVSTVLLAALRLHVQFSDLAVSVSRMTTAVTETYKLELTATQSLAASS